MTIQDTPFEIFEEGGDALNPGMDAPTDIYEIRKLDKKQREERLQRLEEQAAFIYQAGVDELDGHEHVGTVIMWSGGNDSNVLAHFTRPLATHAVMANTGIGVEQTRQFVRDTCKEWGLPLIEKHAQGDDTYENFVSRNGFPGPPMHNRCFQRLKHHQFRRARAELVKDGTKQRVIFVGGRRRAESQNRKKLGYLDRDGSLITVSPLINWTKLDMSFYRIVHQGVPLNPVSVELGMSGECLCGANAKPGELERVRRCAPEAAQEIDRLTEIARSCGIKAPFDQWGHGQGNPPEDQLCSEGCGTAATDPLWDHIDPFGNLDPAHTNKVTS